MSRCPSTCGASARERLGWSLLHFVWQGALIGLAALLHSPGRSAVLGVHEVSHRDCHAGYAAGCPDDHLHVTGKRHLRTESWQSRVVRSTLPSSTQVTGSIIADMEANPTAARQLLPPGSRAPRVAVAPPVACLGARRNRNLAAGRHRPVDAHARRLGADAYPRAAGRRRGVANSRSCRARDCAPARPAARRRDPRVGGGFSADAHWLGPPRRVAAGSRVVGTDALTARGDPRARARACAPSRLPDQPAAVRCRDAAVLSPGRVVGVV